jgi:hypothetical protein
MSEGLPLARLVSTACPSFLSQLLLPVVFFRKRMLEQQALLHVCRGGLGDVYRCTTAQEEQVCPRNFIFHALFCHSAHSFCEIDG